MTLWMCRGLQGESDSSRSGPRQCIGQFGGGRKVLCVSFTHNFRCIRFLLFLISLSDDASDSWLSPVNGCPLTCLPQVKVTFSFSSPKVTPGYLLGLRSRNLVSLIKAVQSSELSM